MASIISQNLSLINRLALASSINKIGSLAQWKIYSQQLRFAGHSKWQNIRNTKTANDMAKGKMIARYVQLVKRSILANNMQTDPKLNDRLNSVLIEANKMNVPKATLERAIERARNMKALRVTLNIEGPGRSAIIVICETENTNELRREIKKICKKHKCALLTDDSLMNMFKGQGFIRATSQTKDGRTINEDYAEEAAIIANANEVNVETYEDATEEKLSKIWVFSTDPDRAPACKGELEKQGLEVISCDVELVPYRAINYDPETYGKVEEFIRTLKELEQVEDIYHNASTTESNT